MTEHRPSNTPHALVFGLLSALIAYACASEEGVDFQLSVQAPLVVSVTGAEDLSISVGGSDPSFPITAVLEGLRCPQESACKGGRQTFEEPAQPVIWRDALTCDVPSDTRYEYSLEVFDAVGLDTQPARFSFQCVE